MNNKDYEKLVKRIVVRDNGLRNILVSFVSGGLIGVLGELLSNILINYCGISMNDSYTFVFIIFVLIGSVLTGIGVFDKVLSIFKCGLIVPSTGFANSMTSSAMDSRSEGYVKGIGANIFKLTGSIILYGIVFGIIFGFIKGVIL